MVQAGVALIVACLPTLRPIFHGVSPETFIRSVRSKFSLESLGHRSDLARSEQKPARTSDDSAAMITRSDVLMHTDPTKREHIENFELGSVGTRRGDIISMK